MVRFQPYHSIGADVAHRIESKENLKDWLDYELLFYGAGKTAGLKRILGLGERALLGKHQRLLRIYEYHLNMGHRIRGGVAHLRLARFQNRYALHIPPNCCGRGLRVMHLGPVLINGNARLGEECRVHMNVAVVATNGSPLAARIGNGVVLGVGSTVIGDVEIADDIVVGAGAVVTRSFSTENVAVAGVPAKVVSMNGRRSCKVDEAGK